MNRQYLFFLTGIALLFSLFTSGCKLACEDPVDQASVDQLAGDWVRVESNNPTADDVKVEVVGNSATITDKANSNFQVGQVKWRSITAETQNTFAYQELGSDGNYYDATLFLAEKDEIIISVNHTGAGNSQKWIRDDGTNTSGTPKILACDFFKQDRTLSKTSANPDYIVTCVMDVTANLVIEPGVVIEFEENAGLGVYDAGTLNAVGTQAEPIVLRGKVQNRGHWRGIHLETNSANNRLEYVEVSDAGSNYVYCCNDAATFFLKDGKAVIQNSTFSNGEGYGLVLGKDATLPSFASNTITSHTAPPLKLALTQAGSLDSQSDFSGNDVDFVQVIRRGVAVASTVPALSVPYLLEGNVFDITDALTLKAGVEMVFEENGGLGIYDGGSIKIEGTASAEVRLRGKQALPGYWRGIHIETSSLDNQIKYAHISDAGSNYVYCCNEIATILLKNSGTLLMQNTRLSNGDAYGLYAGKDSELRDYGNNTITSHDKAPLYLAIERVGELDGESSDYTGNQEDFIGIFNSDLDNPIIWPAANVPYLVDPVVLDIKESLTIDPGTEIVFQANGGLGIYDNGSLYAVGSSSKQITFRGKNNVQGYWRGIHVETNSLSNEFEYVHLLNAASNYVYCCNDKAGLFLKDGRMKVTNSVIAYNDGCGIFVKVGAILTESNNTFSNNSAGNICQ